MGWGKVRWFRPRQPEPAPDPMPELVPNPRVVVEQDPAGFLEVDISFSGVDELHHHVTHVLGDDGRHLILTVAPW